MLIIILKRMFNYCSTRCSIFPLISQCFQCCQQQSTSERFSFVSFPCCSFPNQCDQRLLDERLSNFLPAFDALGCSTCRKWKRFIRVTIAWNLHRLVYSWRMLNELARETLISIPCKLINNASKRPRQLQQLMEHFAFKSHNMLSFMVITCRQSTTPATPTKISIFLELVSGMLAS